MSCDVISVGKVPFDRNSAEYSHVIVRRDLSAEQQTVQAIHAAMAATAEFGGLSPTTRLVLMSIESESELMKLAERLSLSGVDYSLFHEPDHATGYSALATKPGPISERKMFKKFKLWRNPELLA